VFFSSLGAWWADVGVYCSRPGSVGVSFGEAVQLLCKLLEPGVSKVDLAGCLYGFAQARLGLWPVLLSGVVHVRQ
jgi:hypothetical protein